MKYEEFGKKAQAFFVIFDKKLIENGIDLRSYWNFDHICYRTESNIRYDQLCDGFTEFGFNLGEFMVNGRPISTFKLDRPLYFRGCQIDVLEVPAPKQGVQARPEGFEHIEVACDIGFGDLEYKYKNLAIKRSGLKKNFNREFVIDLDGMSLKFHHMSLESVIKFESHHKVFEAFKKSHVMDLLANFDPQIVGTFPLGISVESSDIDILIYNEDFVDLKAILLSKIGHFEKFNMEISQPGVHEYIVCQFEVNGVSFEIFGMQIKTTEQRAFRHFQIEERLLKLGGVVLMNKIRELRCQGYKTEPSFSKVLGIEGDPYVGLLDLHKKSEKELMAMIEGQKE